MMGGRTLKLNRPTSQRVMFNWENMSGEIVSYQRGMNKT